MFAMAYFAAIRQKDRPLPDLLARLLARVDRDVLVKLLEQFALGLAEKGTVGENDAVHDAVEDRQSAFLCHRFKGKLLPVDGDQGACAGMIPAQFLEQFLERLRAKHFVESAHSAPSDPSWPASRSSRR